MAETLKKNKNTVPGVNFYAYCLEKRLFRSCALFPHCCWKMYIIIITLSMDRFSFSTLLPDEQIINLSCLNDFAVFLKQHVAFGHRVKEICNHLTIGLKNKEVYYACMGVINSKRTFHQFVKNWQLWGSFLLNIKTGRKQKLDSWLF